MPSSTPCSPTRASPAAKAVRAATADGIRLSQKEADRIKTEVGLPVAQAAPGGVDPALFAAATQEVEQFAAIVEAQRAHAQSYGADIAAGADRLEAGEGGVAALVAMTRAMAERTKAVEQQLTAARDETQQLQEKLAEAGEEARSDPLTGLPNRRAFEERLAELERSNAMLSLAICDIDHFKRVNDNYGHAVGDRVIKAVAQTLRDNCAGNMVARIGGEEFVVLFPGLAPRSGGGNSRCRPRRARRALFQAARDRPAARQGHLLRRRRVGPPSGRDARRCSGPTPCSMRPRMAAATRYIGRPRRPRRLDSPRRRADEPRPCGFSIR